MADEKFSQLPDGVTPQATDEFAAARGVGNVRLDWVSLKAAAEADSVLDGDAAGGVLSGTYPDPGFAVDMATQAELNSEAGTRAADDATIAGALATHIADPTDAHAGTAIGNTPAGGVAATTVQGAINELDTEKANVANAVMDGDAAGGALGGTYPNPSFAVDMATQAELDAVSTVANAAVPKALYDANTVLAANTDDTPAAVTMAASTILARLAAGSIKAATPAELRTLLDVPTNAEAILDTIIDAKGDLIVGTAADTPARKAVGATNGMMLQAQSAQSDGLLWALPPGYEFDYAQVTSSLNITATTEAGADTYVSGAAVTYDGSTVIMIEVFIPWMNVSVSAGANIPVVVLYDGSSSIGRLTAMQPVDSTVAIAPVGVLSRRLTPSNGSHTYSVRAFKAVGGGTQGLNAGAGGSAAYMPGYIRQIKV